MDYAQEREILLETIKSQQETIRKLVDAIAEKDNIRIVPFQTVPYQPVNPSNTITSPFYYTTHTVNCDADGIHGCGEPLLDSADKERLINGDRTD